MKVKFYMEKDNALFSQVTDLEKESQKRGETCSFSVGDVASFRLTRCYNNGQPYDDGTGEESSWWSVFVGPANEMMYLVEKGRGVFTRGDKVDLLPVLKNIEDKDELACYIHNHKKPRERCPGMFRGPDRQKWATNEVVERLFRRSCNLPNEASEIRII